MNQDIMILSICCLYPSAKTPAPSHRASEGSRVAVKINSIIIPCVNDQHIEAIATKIAELKVDIMNSMAFLPVAGAEFENIAPRDSLLVASTRLKAARHVAQMSHCARCRADAVGLINEKMTGENLITLQEFARPGADTEARPYIAVASGAQEGMLVNQHLGEAARLIILSRINPRHQHGLRVSVNRRRSG